MKEKIQEAFKQVHSFFYNTYGSTKRALTLLFLLLNSLGITYLIHEEMGELKGVICFLVLYSITCAVTALLVGISWVLQRFFAYYGVLNLLLMMIFFMLLFISLFSAYTPSENSLLSAFAVVIVEAVLARCIYAFFKNKKRNLFVVLPLCLALAGNAVFIHFVHWNGKEAKYVQSCYEQNEKIGTGEECVVYEGKYHARSFDYGMREQEVHTKTVDMSPYMESYHGIKKWTRDRYWGYGPDKIPLEGLVWYPEEEGNYPILFLIHGNADMIIQSYLGYDYLGEYLAKDGYIVVSVNENWCNYYMGFGFGDENDARAILLLENMKEVLKWNETAGNPLFGKIASDKIAIAGHSRGGEAVSTACEFNTQSYYPDDANQTLNYHFPIKTVFAIAPTSDQYRPSDRTVSIRNVNYFLIHGSYDQDVTRMMGINQYNHVKLDYGFQKGYLYVAGANHGQFNTNWGRFDGSYLARLGLNTKPIMKASDQQTVLKQYLKVCLDTTLKGKNKNKDFLWDIDSYGKNLPKTVYMQSYQNGTYEPLAEYEEDGDVTTTTSGDSIAAKRFAKWAEVNTSEYEDYNSDNHAVYLEWNSSREAVYEIEIPSRNLTSKNLVFDIMNLRKEDARDTNPTLLNLTIQFEDSNGNTADIRLKDLKAVYPPSKVVYSKIVALLKKVTYRMRFQTVSVPIDELQEMHLEVDFGKIKKIRFLCNVRADGKILLDHIGLQS